MVLPRAHEKPPIPIPSHTPSPLVSLSASLQCKRENATAVHKNPWSWAMAIFMRLNIFITKIALRGAPGLVVGGFSLSLNLRDNQFMSISTFGWLQLPQTKTAPLLFN